MDIQGDHISWGLSWKGLRPGASGVGPARAASLTGVEGWAKADGRRGGAPGTTAGVMAATG